jgi:P4 family phage/plasmid primase-like protien
VSANDQFNGLSDEEIAALMVRRFTVPAGPSALVAPPPPPAAEPISLEVAHKRASEAWQNVQRSKSGEGTLTEAEALEQYSRAQREYGTALAAEEPAAELVAPAESAVASPAADSDPTAPPPPVDMADDAIAEIADEEQDDKYRNALTELDDAKISLEGLEGCKDDDALHQARQRVSAAEHVIRSLEASAAFGAGNLAAIAAHRKQQRQQKPDYIDFVDMTDSGNAELLRKLSGGNLRYVHETEQWLRWDGRRWHVDTHESFATGYAKRVAAYWYAKSEIGGEFVHDPDGMIIPHDRVRKWAMKSRSRAEINAMLDLARKIRGVAISLNELDKDPWLLGVENGVVDLRDGSLRRRESREDYITKRCPVRYNPRAEAPRWKALIEQATGAPLPVEYDAQGNINPQSVGRYAVRSEFERYLWKALGYALTGSNREQKFFFAIGEGSNGKGLIFDTVKAIMGPYAVTIPASLFMLSKFDGDAERPTALAATLAGARLAVASEVREGQRLNAAAIKSHTGDAEQTARRMRENPFTFIQTHKVFLQTNVQPALDHIDAAMRGRLHLAPFDRRWNRPGEIERDPTLPDGDKDLATTLKSEYEGILAWLVRGAMFYQRDGLNPPGEVTLTTRNYIKAQDHLGRWLATMKRCPAHPYGTKAAALFGLFSTWCAQEGCPIDPPNQNAFSRALRARGIESKETRMAMMWGLTTPPPSFADGPLPSESAK